MKCWLLALLTVFSLQPLSAAPGMERVVYGEDEGISSDHITQILQDQYGFIWLSTWNGLNRFDGREFVTFKTRPGDKSGMSTDRIRNIAINDDHPDILNCKTDHDWYHFSLNTGTFMNVSRAEAGRLQRRHGHGNGVSRHQQGILTFVLRDRQGLVWTIDQGRLLLDRSVAQRVDRCAFAQPAEGKCFFRDHDGRYWMTSKEDRGVRLYTKDPASPLFLSAAGTLSRSAVPFAAPVYSICQSSHGDMFLGCKPGGLYRLRWHKDRFLVERVKGTADLRVYDIKEDRYGRLWLATMGHGIVCLSHGRLRFFRVGVENRVRRIYLLPHDLLMATSTEGLVTMSTKNPGKVYVNKREPGRAASLAASACMSMVRLDGHYFIATESGGIDEILSTDLLNSHLAFRHFNTTCGLGSDAIQALAVMGRQILAVSGSRLMLLNPKTGECRNFGSQFFHEKLHFSEATPLRKANGDWMIGLLDGAVFMPEKVLAPDTYVPDLVLTSLTVGDKPVRYAVNTIRHLRLQSDERRLILTFAALDYRGPEDIQYAYRMEGDSAWHYLGTSNQVALPRLSPGKFVLQLRCTNAEGTWSPRIRTLSVEVVPVFTETVWFHLLLLVLLLGLVASILWVRNYIRQIKKSQQETLTAYLTLVEKTSGAVTAEKEQPAEAVVSVPALSSADKAFMDRVMNYVERHIADSDADLADMAAEAAVSVSGLNRKMKLLVGLTPGEFLKEARLKHACAMLGNTAETVSAISFACGFSDPKYFSRVFRQSVGVSPSQYRNKVQNQGEKGVEISD